MRFMFSQPSGPIAQPRGGPGQYGHSALVCGPRSVSRYRFKNSSGVTVLVPIVRKSRWGVLWAVVEPSNVDPPEASCISACLVGVAATIGPRQAIWFVAAHINRSDEAYVGVLSSEERAARLRRERQRQSVLRRDDTSCNPIRPSLATPPAASLLRLVKIRCVCQL